jgi:hypothetical protein
MWADGSACAAAHFSTSPRVASISIETTRAWSRRRLADLLGERGRLGRPGNARRPPVGDELEDTAGRQPRKRPDVAGRPCFGEREVAQPARLLVRSSSASA